MGSLRSDGGFRDSDAGDEADDEEDEGYVDQPPADPTSPDMRRQLHGTRRLLDPLCEMPPPSVLGQHFYTPQGRAILRSQSWDEAWYGRVVRQVADKACSLKMAGMTCPICTESSSNSMDVFEKPSPQPASQKSRKQNKGKVIPSKKLSMATSGKPESRKLARPVSKWGAGANERHECVVASKSKPVQKGIRGSYGNVSLPTRDKAFKSLAVAEANSAPELALLPTDNAGSGSTYLLQRFLCNIDEEATCYERFNDGNQPPRRKGMVGKTADAPTPSKPPAKKHTGNEPQTPKAGRSNQSRFTTAKPGRTVQLSRRSDESEEAYEASAPSKGRMKRSRERRPRARRTKFLSTCHVFRSDFLDTNHKLPRRRLLETTSANGFKPARFSSSCDFELPEGCNEDNRQTANDKVGIQQQSSLAPLAMQKTARGKHCSCREETQLSYNHNKDGNVRGEHTHKERKVRHFRGHNVFESTTAFRHGQSNTLMTKEGKFRGINSPNVSFGNRGPDTQKAGETPRPVKITAPAQAQPFIPTADNATSTVDKFTANDKAVELSIKLEDQPDDPPAILANACIPRWDVLTRCKASLQLADAARSTSPAIAEITGNTTEDQDEALYDRNKFLRNRAIFASAANGALARCPTSGPKYLSTVKPGSAEVMLRGGLEPRTPDDGTAKGSVAVLEPEHHCGQSQFQRNACAKEPEATLQQPVFATIYQADKKKTKKHNVDSVPWLKSSPSSEEISSLITRAAGGLRKPRCFEHKEGSVPGVTAGGSHSKNFIQHGPAVCSNAMKQPFPRRHVDALDLEERFSTRCKIPEAKTLMHWSFRPSVISKSGTTACVNPQNNAASKKSERAARSNSFDTTAGRAVTAAANGIGHKATQFIGLPRPSGQALPWSREPGDKNNHYYKRLDTGATSSCTEIVKVQGHRVGGTENSSVPSFQRRHQTGRPGVGLRSEDALAKQQAERKWVGSKRPSRPQAVMLCHDAETAKEKPVWGKYSEAGYINGLEEKQMKNTADGTTARQSTTHPDKSTALGHPPLEQQLEASYSEPSKLLEGEDTEVSAILEAEIKNAARADVIMPISVCVAAEIEPRAQCLHPKPSVMTRDSTVQMDSPWDMRKEQQEWAVKHYTEDNKPLFRPIVAETSLYYG